MYKCTKRLDSGNEQEILWKYMSLSKFIYMLMKQKLYFSRLDQFEDVFEAMVPQHSISKIVPNAIDILKQQESFRKRSTIIRLITYASCFHINEYESAAMWKLYADNAGIAIQTRVGKLISALEREKEDVYIGKVNYIDEKSEVLEYVDNLGLTFTKRKSFMSEHELRCTIILGKDYRAYDWIDEPKPLGYNAELDVSTFIENVYISPYAPPYLTEIVIDILDRYNIKAPVIESDLLKIY